MGSIERGHPAATLLRGRSQECAVVERLLDDARAGHGSVLVVRGDPGVGKTSLLEHAVRQAAGFRVLRTAGVEAEMGLAHAGLHQLCAPVVDQLDQLPVPQGDALRVAFGMATGDPPDRFLIALAALGLVAASAQDRPTLCVVDDAQWLDGDSIQALGFIARRLPVDRVAMVFTLGEPSGRRQLTGLPELLLGGLPASDARALFAAALTGPMDPGVRERIIDEARGNPLALLELARGSGPAELAGGFALPAVVTTDHIDRGVMRRLEGLPADTRRLVVLAAADPVGEPVLVWRGAEHLGIPANAAGPASDVGLIEFGAKVSFQHPLVRSAAYRSAPLRERQAAHDALARATDPELDPDRRAWHLAQTTIEPSEPIADELERSASRAQRRGGFAAAAAFLERAAALTPDRARRARRVIAAAGAKREAGALETASRLLSAVEVDAVDDLGQAQLEALEGMIAFDQRRGGAAARSLTSAARRLEPLDAALSRQTHLQAMGAAMRVGTREGPGGIDEVARAAQAAPAPAGNPAIVDLLLDGFGALLMRGHSAAAGPLGRALDMALVPGDPVDDRRDWRWLPVAGSAVTIAQELWDAGAWQVVADRHVRCARETGALGQLQLALHLRAWSHTVAGRLEDAERLLEEDRALAEATGNPPLVYADMLLGAFRGNDAHAARLIDATAREAGAAGLQRVVAFAAYAGAVLNNALGRHAAARDVARRAFAGEHAGYGPFLMPELAEAAARTGDVALLESCLAWIGERTRVTRKDWSLGVEARVRALMADGADADVHYRRSIDHLRRTPVATELARTHLLYGEWLRRQGRRVDAREQLRTAHDMLHTMGLVAFAERARRELAATGATPRRRAAETRDDLTPQERQIAQLARDALSNAEIAAQLFLSARTVEWHLSKVFVKLGIASRRELAAALPAEERIDDSRHSSRPAD